MNAAEQKHTPGPWEFDGFEMVVATGLSAPFRIAHRDGADVITGTRTWEANARLIAAAPELLAALSELLDANSYYFPHGNPWGDKARAVIAKAEGR